MPNTEVVSVTTVSASSAGSFLLQMAGWIIFGLCFGFGFLIGEFLAHKVVG